MRLAPESIAGNIHDEVLLVPVAPRVKADCKASKRGLNPDACFLYRIVVSIIEQTDTN
ncbi:uncharacterized protein PHALS_07686 [Plasmopara halstedii]|uniref:Uncharacterized protein n=1 Tax=Plasmopara halstedii TaxID=4781 RepID=A0A0P1B6Z6_PLAHL|nr:uncharacterized protein PHALS_07686 [Plasmopara halstedii]CEG49951.1 hypothetical protein PHALS_07686 [Plasmopara halstedii]|eukprot:XP_024586320.1 hypothetical protein PHALS_07686 [Plasmopara halstedii]